MIRDSVNIESLLHIHHIEVATDQNRKKLEKKV